MHLRAVVEQAARRFQAQQPAAEHGGPRHFDGVAGDFGAVVDRAEDEDAGLVAAVRQRQALHRRHEGTAAGRDQQLVVGLLRAVGARHDFGAAVDLGHAHPGMQRDRRSPGTTPAG